MHVFKLPTTTTNRQHLLPGPHHVAICDLLMRWGLPCNTHTLGIAIAARTEWRRKKKGALKSERALWMGLQLSLQKKIKKCVAGVVVAVVVKVPSLSHTWLLRAHGDNDRCVCTCVTKVRVERNLIHCSSGPAWPSRDTKLHFLKFACTQHGVGGCCMLLLLLHTGAGFLLLLRSCILGTTMVR